MAVFYGHTAPYLALAYALAGRATDALSLLGQIEENLVVRGEAYLFAGEVEEADRLAQRGLAHARERKMRGEEARAWWLLDEIAMRRAETTRIRLVRIPSICQAPSYVAEELLRSEGFTEVHYLQKAGTADIETALASGEADLNGHFAAPLLLRLEAGDPIVILAGLHIGCFALFGTHAIRTIRDLKDKTVAVPALDSSRYVFLASMVAL